MNFFKKDKEDQKINKNFSDPNKKLINPFKNNHWNINLWKDNIDSQENSHKDENSNRE